MPSADPHLAGITMIQTQMFVRAHRAEHLRKAESCEPNSQESDSVARRCSINL